MSASVGGAGAEGKEHVRAKRYARRFRGDLAGSLRSVGEEAVSLLSAAGGEDKRQRVRGRRWRGVEHIQPQPDKTDRHRRFLGRPSGSALKHGKGEILVAESTNQKTAHIEAEPGAAPLQTHAPAKRRRNLDEEQLALTATELATRLGISRAHVWKLLSVGQLPAPVRLGRAVRWDKRVIDAWLAAGAPSAAQWERVKQAQTRGAS